MVGTLNFDVSLRVSVNLGPHKDRSMYLSKGGDEYPSPVRSFSFAIVGINITDLAYSLLVGGALKTHLYNVAPEMASLQHFQQTFCKLSALPLSPEPFLGLSSRFRLPGYLMQEFHAFWIEEDPSDIMEFNRVRSKFHRKILRQLKNLDMALCPHFTASDLHMVNV